MNHLHCLERIFCLPRKRNLPFYMLTSILACITMNCAAISVEAATLESNAQSTQLRTGAQSTTLQTGTQSTMLQTGTQSTMLQTGTQSTTLQTGTQSTTLQTGTQTSLIQGGAQGSLIQGNVERLAGPVNILFVLDCSYSMKEKFGGGIQKIESAKQVMQAALSRIPGDVNLGLRVFGQGMGAGGFNSDPGIDCRQTALLVPLGQGNRRSIIEKVRNIKPFGMTPLEYALRQAAEDDLSGAPGTKTLILITDGADTCGGDPCHYIRTLPLLGIHLKVDVVGVDLKHDRLAKAELNCIAEGSGGKYYDVNNAPEMIESVSNSVNQAISGKVLVKPKGLPATNIETLPDIQPVKP